MLFEFGELYKQMSGSEIVEMAHMEIAEPTIAQAIGGCPHGQGPKDGLAKLRYAPAVVYVAAYDHS